jgi:hypothetical protein
MARHSENARWATRKHLLARSVWQRREPCNSLNPYKRLAHRPGTWVTPHKSESTLASAAGLGILHGSSLQGRGESSASTRSHGLPMQRKRSSHRPPLRGAGTRWRRIDAEAKGDAWQFAHVHIHGDQTRLPLHGASTSARLAPAAGVVLGRGGLQRCDGTNGPP